VAGHPASYFWKDMIHRGDYVHPARDYSLAVDDQRLAKWAENGAKMLEAGLAIPINVDHSDAARDVVGYVKQFKLDGDRLLGLCQLIGEESALTAARNLASVGIDPHFVDGEGRQWGEAIVHLALTPVPVVPDQDQFVMADEIEPADAEVAGSSALPCTPEQFATLCELIGEGLSEANPVDRIIEQLRSARGTDSAELEAELAAARQQVFQLSSRLPPVVSPDAQHAMAELATAKLDSAVERGALSPLARDRLVAALVKGEDGRGNVMTLSRGGGGGGDRCLAVAVAEILLDNQPIQVGESTRLQAMSRAIPGEESSPIDELRRYMTKIASVSG
jgi:AcrR family transcriptional regulator